MNEPEIVVIGEENKVLKPIQILQRQPKYDTVRWINTSSFDETPQRIELIAKQYQGDLDLIFAVPISKQRSQGTLYLGHWNDGFLSQTTKQ